MSEPTEQQMRLGRLLDLPDFRALLGEWMDSGFSPWAGPVGPDQASDASYVNGRAAFLTALSEEIREYFPTHFNRIQEERFNVRRSTT